MATSTDRRVRRPSDKQDVLDELCDDGPFEARRDVLVFAAALGFSRGRRVPFESSDEPIRWDTMSNRRGTEILVNMLSAATAAEDPQVLEDERFEERIQVFEEYANGGLEILKHELGRSVIDSSDFILKLVRDSLGPKSLLDAPNLAVMVESRPSDGD
jgi:dnd system-associated protein 4